MKKHTIRLNLEFSVTVDETAIPVGDDQESQEYHDHQRRLFQALLSNQERLQAYLCFSVASQLEGIGHREWNELILGKEEMDTEEMLAPTITTLSTEDQSFFKEAEDEEVFYESVEEMDNCFKVELEKAEIVVENGNE